jgi:hypothetical protein
MRSAWNWPKQMPWLVLASAVTAPYGGWIFDLTILILPIFAVLATLAQTQQKLPVTLYILGMLMLSWSALRIQGLADSLWHSPGVLVLSLIMIWWARHAHAQGVSSPVPS